MSEKKKLPDVITEVDTVPAEIVDQFDDRRRFLTSIRKTALDMHGERHPLAGFPCYFMGAENSQTCEIAVELDDYCAAYKTTFEETCESGEAEGHAFFEIAGKLFRYVLLSEFDLANLIMHPRDMW